MHATAQLLPPRRILVPRLPLTGRLLAYLLLTGRLLTGCAGSIAPYDEAAEPARRQALEASLHERLGDAYDLAVPGLDQADLDQGKEVWHKNCDACHGAHGQGDGPRANRMKPPPSDLLDGQRLPQAAEYQIVRDGSPGTGMPGFGGKLPDHYVLAAYRYVIWLREHPPQAQPAR